LEWTDWSEYVQQTTFYPNVTAGQASILATGNPQNREWHSVWSESVGVQYAVNDRLRLRTGYGHHQSPIPESTWDTQFADANSNAYSFGLGYDVTDKLTLDLAYVAAFYDSRNIVNTVSNVLGAFLNGKYSEFVNVGTVSLTYKF
jgi:long-chain fatty acid transport protein